MISVKNTPNNLGVEIVGDFNDFQSLYTALHRIVGDDHQYPSYQLPRLRVLGICYDIRHALQGDGEYEFVSNGLNPEISKNKGFIAPNQNLYLKIRVFWPEILFIQIILNDFIMLHAKRNTKEYFDALIDRKNIWDESIAHIRLFQATINKCIQETIPEITYKRMLGYVISKNNELADYLPYYVDILNLKFINMEREQRLKNISIMAKRIAERGKEYQSMEADLEAVARDNNCPIEDIRVNLEYPKEYDW